MDVRNLRRDNFKSGPHLTRSAAFVQCGALDKKHAQITARFIFPLKYL